MRSIRGTACLVLLGLLLAGGCGGESGLSAVTGMLPIPGAAQPAAAIATKAGAKAIDASRPISDSEEYYIGRAVCARILAKYPLSQDQALTTYVNEVGQAVARKSSRPSTYKGYHFAVLETSEVNAFACPGGIILITKGMIKNCANEDELAAVLAHEVGHVANKDGINSISRARWSQVATAAGAEAARQYGGAVGGTLMGMFESSIDDVFKTIVVNGYSRGAEEAADSAAVSTLTRTGYNSAALPAVLGKMSSTSGGIMKTHPATADRLAKMKGASAASGGKMEEARTKRFKEQKI